MVLAVASTFAANAIIGWPTHWYAFPLAMLLGLWGVFSIESFFEGLMFLVIASVPLAFVLWHNNDFSVGKQLWLSAISGLGAGKLWVGIIR